MAEKEKITMDNLQDTIDRIDREIKRLAKLLTPTQQKLLLGENKEGKCEV